MSLLRDRQGVEPMLLTARQAAKFLCVCEKTLWTMTRAGRIPAVPLGKRGIRYDRRDLLAWVESAKTSCEDFWKSRRRPAKHEPSMNGG